MAIVPHPSPDAPPAFLGQDSLVVAPLLLGWELVSTRDGHETAGRIVEVEAYHGAEDPASHAFRGLTPRTAPMFQAGGTLYCYRSYGIHTCLNIVTGPAGEASAVLIRALEPTVGLEIMAARRHLTNPRLLASGPGRLTQALGITLADSGTVLGGAIRLRPPRTAAGPAAIRTTPRIGVSSAADRPWRFLIAGNPFVSRANAL